VALPSSPVTVLGGAPAVIRQAAARLEGASAAGLAWLAEVLQQTPQLPAGGLPVPIGQQRVPVGPGQLSATVDLRTIQAGRRPGDRLLVSLTFYRGGEPLAAPVSDEMRIEAYGWTAAYVASLGWITREGGSLTFQPTPALSWIARRRGWPGSGDTGLTPSFLSAVGIGLTTVALDFDPDQMVELGLAGTVGLLGNRLLLGAGVNLQSAADRWFGFFSIRLFGAGSQL
jgi:hypothetical protein